MEEVSVALRQYGLETVLLALAINLCTALCKLPIKMLARKAKDSVNITRFIVFMPVVLGFILALCYVKWFARGAILNKNFLQLWLTASSLSLTFYAVTEKLFPAKSKASDKAAAQASKDLIDTIAAGVAKADTNEGQPVSPQKIVLRGHKQHETEE